MKLIDVSFAQLHSPLFMKGNLGDKLDPKNKTGLKLSYDLDSDRLIVQWNGMVSVITNNMSSFQPANPGDLGIANLGEPTPLMVKVTTKGSAMKAGISSAQVETPHGLTRSKL